MTTVTFEAHRPRLFAIAYRLLGSVSEAEDVLQDAWLAWDRHGDTTVAEPAAYLTTIVTRRCLDVLRSARVRRESYDGPWLPEPLLTTDDVAEDVLLAESVRMAFLVVLESLSPAERAALVLHDVFAYDYGELAQILERSEAACRQLVSRARAHVTARRPRFDADRARVEEAAGRFLLACETGEVDALLSCLAEDATLVSDGGGQVSAARRPIVGAGRVARFLAGVITKAQGTLVPRLAEVNGMPGSVVADRAGRTVVALSIDVVNGRVTRVHMVRNPDKLAHLDSRA